MEAKDPEFFNEITIELPKDPSSKHYKEIGNLIYKGNTVVMFFTGNRIIATNHPSLETLENVLSALSGKQDISFSLTRDSMKRRESPWVLKIGPAK